MSELAISIRAALASEQPVVSGLIEAVGLDAAGVLARGSRYWLAFISGLAVGTLGLELGTDAALLRSAAVLPEWRGRAIGALLREHALAEVAAGGISRIYLFSTDAGPYWQRQGFVEVPVPEVVAALPASFQVRHYDNLGWLPTEVAFRKDLL